MAARARKPLIAGNWKMNGTRASLAGIRALARALGQLELGCEIVVCPPATLLSASSDALKRRLWLGAQDCHPSPSGAHTGDISAEMLADAGAKMVIVGHSERRADHGETNALVAAKTAAVHRARLKAIICVGETQAERDSGQTLAVIKAQLKSCLPKQANAANTIIAYEPVWAIGTGRTPTLDDIAQVHAFIREELGACLSAEVAGKMRILYGGSVKPQNAPGILALTHVDGALVGGASLKAADFLPIIRVYAKPAKKGTKRRKKAQGSRSRKRLNRA